MERPVQSAVRPVSNFGGDCSGEVAAKAGGPHEDDFRFVFFNQLAEGFVVAFGAVVPKDGGVYQVGLVCAVGKGFAAEVFYLFTEDDGGEFYSEGVGQFTPFAEQFPGDFGRFAFGLFDKDPDPFVGGKLFCQGGGFFVYLFGGFGSGRQVRRGASLLRG